MSYLILLLPLPKIERLRCGGGWIRVGRGGRGGKREVKEGEQWERKNEKRRGRMGEKRNETDSLVSMLYLDLPVPFA